MLKLRIVCGWLLCIVVPAAQTPQYSYQVVHVYPHDRDAFTQGLEFRAGFLYEGTGLNGHSTLRKVMLENGRVVQEIDLPPEYFENPYDFFQTWTEADLTQSRKVLKYEPRYDLEKGIDAYFTSGKLGM